MTKNQLQYHANLETQRHNLATEQETKRSNLAEETENYRSNLAREQENFRSNTAKELENNRHNVVSEKEEALWHKMNYHPVLETMKAMGTLLRGAGSIA